MSGLAAACALQGHARVTLIEKSRGVSGRAATRRYPRPSRSGEPLTTETVRYDHGANHFTLRATNVAELVRSLDAVPLRIHAPVWVLGADGAVEPGDPQRDADARWTFADGIRTLGTALHERSGAQILTETRATSARRDEAGRWFVGTDGGGGLGPFDALLLTPPGPQTAELGAQMTGLPGDVHENWLGGLGAARYRSQFSIALGYAERLRLKAPFYALIHNDGQHPLAWLTVEDRKPGHVPDGQSVLIAQMQPAWTQQHYDAPREAVAEMAEKIVASVLAPVIDGDVPPSAWWGAQRWRYSLPDAGYAAATLRLAEPHGLFVAGDSVAGKGRVELALETGLDAAGRIVALLEARA